MIFAALRTQRCHHVQKYPLAEIPAYTYQLRLLTSSELPFPALKQDAHSLLDIYGFLMDSTCYNTIAAILCVQI